MIVKLSFKWLDEKNITSNKLIVSNRLGGIINVATEPGKT